MGIRFYCPNGHKLNVKEYQAGRRGVCPYCGAKFLIPSQSTRKSSKEERAALRALAAASTGAVGDTSGLIPPQDSSVFMPFMAAQSAQPKTAKPEISPGESSVSATKNNTEGQIDAKTPMASPAVPMIDPITAAGNVVWYVRPPAGGQYGPARGGVMRQWLAEGRITPDTLVWREGWRDWLKAATIFPQLVTSGHLTEISPAVLRPLPANSTEVRESVLGKSHKMQKTILALLIMALVLLLGIFFWLVMHGLRSASDYSAPLDSRQNSRYTQTSPDSMKSDQPPH